MAIPIVFHLAMLMIFTFQSNAFAHVKPQSILMKRSIGESLGNTGKYQEGFRRQLVAVGDNDSRGKRSGGVLELTSSTTEDVEDKKRDMGVSSVSAIANWYMNQLNTHELRTKFISSGILALVGDVCAQKVGHYISTKNISGHSLVVGLDHRRMVAMFVNGLLCTGPLLHYVYVFFEKIIPTQCANVEYVLNDSSSARNRKFMATLTHVLLDNFVMVALYIAAIMVTTALIEGQHAIILRELKHDLIPAVKVSYKVSIMGYAPLQLLSFHFLPMKLRVLAVNIMDILWVTVMSYVTHRNRH